MNKQVYAYLRVSSKGSVDKDGLTRQEEAVRSYAHGHSMSMAHLYREEGISGELINRPALQSMIAHLTAGPIKVVLVERLDRLARDIVVQETLIKQLHTLGITLVSTHEPDLCSQDTSRKLIRQMLGVIAEYEKCVIVDRMRAARERIKASGVRCEGRKPYGYYGHELEPLNRIRALRKNGLSYSRIAQTLNMEGIKPRYGKQWWTQSVASVVANGV